MIKDLGWESKVFVYSMIPCTKCTCGQGRITVSLASEWSSFKISYKSALAGSPAQALLISSLMASFSSGLGLGY